MAVMVPDGLSGISAAVRRMRPVKSERSMFRLPLHVDAPFVVSDAIFVNPRYRGTRLIREDRSELFLRKPIRVHDARALSDAPTLGGEGFQLLSDNLAPMDFDDPETVAGRFHEHCRELVSATTGCAEVKVKQHEFRDGLGKGPGGRGSYASAAHSDVCAYIEDVLEDVGGRHFALYNIWRSIDFDRDIERMPLALCDGRTVDPADIIYADRARLTEPLTYLVDCRLIHDMGQCWYYFPRMGPDEALIFRQHDTREEKANLRPVFHTAFRDPTTRDGAPLRRTVEVRLLAIFDEVDPDPAGRRARFEAEIPETMLDGTVSTLRHEKMVDWEHDC